MRGFSARYVPFQQDSVSSGHEVIQARRLFLQVNTTGSSKQSVISARDLLWNAGRDNQTVELFDATVVRQIEDLALTEKVRCNEWGSICF